MLKSMRSKRNALKWTLIVVIAAFIGFIFFDWGMGSARQGMSDTTLLKVNSISYPQQEFLRLFKQLVNNYRQQYKDKFTMALAIQMNLAETVLQEMVNQAIVTREAQKLGLTITDGELSDHIKKMPMFQRDGQFIGAQEYRTFVQQMGYTLADFEKDLKNFLLYEKVRDYLSAGAIISKDKLWEDYQREYDTADVEYLKLSILDLKSEIKADDEELINYYEQNKNDFKSQEKRRGDYLVLRTEDFKKDVKLKDSEIFDYFQNNKNFFKVPARTKVARIALKYVESDREARIKELEELREKLDQKNFGDYAKQLSQDDKASQGGDWGYYEWNNLSEIEKGVIEKAQQGEISYVLDNGSEAVLLLVSEKAAEGQKSFDEVKDQIKSFLIGDRSRKLVSGKAEKLYKMIEGSQNLKAELAESGSKVVDSGMLTNGETIKDADSGGYISQKLFSLKENEISAPIEMMEGFAIVQLREIKKPEVLPFGEVKEQVRERVIKEKKLEEITNRALRILDQVKNMKPEEVPAFLKTENLNFLDATYKRGNKLASFSEYPDLDRIIFSLNASEFASILRYSDDIVILRLKSKSVKTDAEFENEFPSYYLKKQKELKSELLNIYLQSKSKDYKIRLNEKLFLETKDNLLKRGNI